MAQRYYVPGLVNQTTVSLPDDEAHHALRVMRATVGDELVLFDGENREAIAVVESLSRKEVYCRITQLAEVDRESKRLMIVGVALPKGDRARSVIEKAVELGAHTLVPITTRRSVALPSEGAMRRLNRYVIDASKQCGRNRLMRIGEPMKWDEFVSVEPSAFVGEASSFGDSCIRVLAHPGGNELSAVQSSGPIVMAIGPEGGFTDDEVQQAIDAGWQHVGLGSRILRVETAVSVLLTIATRE